MNKPRFNNCVLALLLSGAVLTAPSALALSAKRASELRKAVTSVPVPEMPAKAAELVQQAEKSDRNDVVITVVRAAVSKRKASGPVVVAAISKVAPDLAATAAAAASQLVADQSANITQAAIAAAPNQSEAILAAVANPTVQITGNQRVTGQSGTVQTSGNLAASTPGQTIPSAAANSTVALTGTTPASPTTIIDATVTPPAQATAPARVTESVRPTVPAATSVASITVAAPLARGEADANGPSSGRIGHDTHPINDQDGGRGDGEFPTFKPNKPTAPHPKDYSKPRS